MADQALLPERLYSAIRGVVLAGAVAGLVLGVLALFQPTDTTRALGVIFGIAVIVGGLIRLATAVFAVIVPGPVRLMFGALGLLMIVAGVIALGSSDASVTFLATYIGVAWIFGGVNDVMLSRGLLIPRWLALVSGLVGILAGAILIIAPGSIEALVWWGGILLIVVSLATIFTLPRSQRRATG